MANDLFRMVSLRRSKPSHSDTPPSSSPDSRVRYRSILDRQHSTEAVSSTKKASDLKARFVAVSKQIEQFEKLRLTAVDAHMSLLAEEPVPTASAAERSAPASRGRTAGTPTRRAPPASRARVADASTRSVDPQRFLERVEARLTDKEMGVFRNAVGASVRDVSDLLSHLDVAMLIFEANSLCAQIQAVEQNLGDDLPTVRPDAEASSKPIIAAVGWGDLIVARESLVGYEAHEISHIENILPGESKVRELKRTATTEQVEEYETVTEKETEKDSQTTDRYELQTQSQEAINRDFSISAGVNTSGKYGMTQVDTSLDAAFSQSQSQSKSSSLNTARDVVARAVERTLERVRTLRRLTITEKIRELNRHELANAGGTGTPKSISGIYVWVEKVHKVELRHYGSRMMVEFHVPEPALSLLERSAVRNMRKVLPPFNISPADIRPENYMCLAQQFGALDVEPPPTALIEVGFGWTSTINEDAENWAEDQFSAIINIPTGYRPTWSKVAWSGLQGKKENREFNFAFSIAGKSQGIEHTVVTYDGVVLNLDAQFDWPQGVPISGRLRGTWDGAMYVQATLKCVRTQEALDAWRLRMWQALRAGYETLQRKLVQEEQQEAYKQNLLMAAGTDGPEAENRRIERAELQKWAIKSMRKVPQNFNAVEQIGEMQEINPVYADAQAPVVRFYEDAFEWEHMNYFLYPYHWARRASWRMRNSVQAVDQRFKEFLQAGAARVIVPITPGYEDKVAWFLDPSNAQVGELMRILSAPPTSPPSGSDDEFRDLWIELLTDRKPDMARGSGTLNVKKGQTKVEINSDSQWIVSEQRDIGRELHIAGAQYEVTSVTDATSFSLDRPYEGENDTAARYVAGSTLFGLPWTVNVPTSLIVLAENIPTLKSLAVQ
jgi:hypothetical protein